MTYSNFKKEQSSSLMKSIVFLITILFFMGCKNEKPADLTITLANNSNMELSQKAVSIKRNFLDRVGDQTGFPLLTEGMDTIPSQVNDLDGDGQWDELFLVTDFGANEKKSVQLHWVENTPQFPVRTSVRFGKRTAKDEPVHPAMEEILTANEVHEALGYQRYQTDGPSWENDKVGFRHYLDGRNATDVFGKKTPGITPENVGINNEGAVVDNYHVMHDWGRDIFPVGNSVGLGGFALLSAGKIERLGILTNDTLNNIEETTFKIVAEGPVNSVLSYDYHNWKVSSGNVYQAKEMTSIWPGMYGYKKTVSLEGLKENDMLLIGLSNINNQKPLDVVRTEHFVCLIQHDSLTYDRQWVMGTAIIVPKKGYEGYMEAPKTGQLTDSYLAKFKVDNDEPISYYGVAGWELSADKNFKDATYFKNYVVNLAGQLSAEVFFEIKK